MMLEYEQLKTEKLQTSYNALMGQINPHFFFNSLNGLNSLIRSGEKEQTLTYLDELSNVFRYILQSNKKEMVTLAEELQFVNSGTLVLALAHQIGEDNCTIYTQDISSKSNEFLRLNLILNNLVHSLGNVVHDDTLVAPRHLNAQKNGLARFDYIVSNPPFNMDFSDNQTRIRAAWPSI